MSYDINGNLIINLLVSQYDIISKPTFTIAHHLHKIVFTKLSDLFKYFINRCVHLSLSFLGFIFIVIIFF